MREVSQGIIPEGTASHVCYCTYCNTACADEEARKGHEALCEKNPASVAFNAVENARIAAARAAAKK